MTINVQNLKSAFVKTAGETWEGTKTIPSMPSGQKLATGAALFVGIGGIFFSGGAVPLVMGVICSAGLAYALRETGREVIQKREANSAPRNTPQ